MKEISKVKKDQIIIGYQSINYQQDQDQDNVMKIPKLYQNHT